MQCAGSEGYPKGRAGQEGLAGGGEEGVQVVFNVVLKKSILTQIRQFTLYISNSQGYVDGFGEELTSAKRLLQKRFRVHGSGFRVTPGDAQESKVSPEEERSATAPLDPEPWTLNA